jgi:hypothetical protein
VAGRERRIGFHLGFGRAVVGQPGCELPPKLLHRFVEAEPHAANPSRRATDARCVRDEPNRKSVDLARFK